MLPSMTRAKNDIAVPAGAQKLVFLENKGQITDENKKKRTDIQYVVNSEGVNVFVGNNKLQYQFTKVDNPEVMSAHYKMKAASAGSKAVLQERGYTMIVELVGANPNARPTAMEPQEFVARYYSAAPRHRNDLHAPVEAIEAHSFGKIVYKEVYPGVDWVIYSKNNRMEYEFVLRPGADASRIKLKYNGATSLRINEDGSLTAGTPMGTITEAAPYSFTAEGKTVASSYKVEGDVLSFNVGAYSGTLTIDPSIMWGTYYGDAGDDVYNNVAMEGTTMVYAVGSTTSTSNIAWGGVGQTTSNGAVEMFLSKFNSSGVLQWTTYYGTTGNDFGFSVSYSNNNVVIGGYSDYWGDDDLAIAQFTSAGTLTLLEGLAGDINLDRSYGVAYAPGGTHVYVAGVTNDNLGTWYTTGTQQASLAGNLDGILLKIDQAGAFTWATYYGGTALDYFTSVKVNTAGDVFPCGITASTSGVATSGTFGGIYDGLLTRFNPNTGVRVWGSYFGGAGDDEVLGSYTDGSGSTYITGITAGTGGISTTNVHQAAFGGGTWDAFASMYNASGTKVWGTYFGGSGEDNGYGIFANSTGEVFITGETSSGNAIASNNTYQQALNGGFDAFLAKFTTLGASGWGTYYGGTGNDNMNGITGDNASTLFVTGYSTSTGNIATTGAEQTFNAGLGDGVLARFCDNPVINDTIAGPSTVCEGSTQTYSIPVIPGATSYTWTLPGGWSGTSTTNSITVTVGANSGNVTVVANGSCGSSPQVVEAITVNPLPSTTITPNGPTTFCQGGNVILQAPTGTGYTYQWYQGAPIPGANNASYTATAAGNYHVVITSNGCSATSATVTVTVNPTPAAPTVGSNSPVCVGDALNLTATSTTSGVTYSWAGPNTFTSTQQNPTIAGVTTLAAGTYTATVTANGCTSTGTTTVVVNPGPPAQPGTITGSVNVCSGSSQTYSIAAVVGATSYTWTLPGGWTGTSTTNSITVTAGTAGGNILVSAGNNCGNSPDQVLAVTVTQAPPATITPAGPTTFCQGGSVVLNANTGTGLTYQWYNGTTAIAGATSASYTATASGTYTVEVSDGACAATSASVTVTVNPLPNPVISQSGATLTCTPAFTSYQWHDANGPIAGATSQSYTATADGNYYVVVTDGNGCTNQSNTIQLMLSVNDVNGAALVSLYPNPNEGSFTINGTFRSNDGKVEVTIVDIAGRVVHKQLVTITGDKLAAEINMSSTLASGMYTLKLSSDVQNGVVPFVKK